MPEFVKSQAVTTKNQREKMPPPAYFLSLKIANFRCFGPEQTLDLSDGNGRPARWTVILGENGVGKTSLLQCLAGLQPVQEIEQENLLLMPTKRVFPAQQPFHYWVFGTQEEPGTLSLHSSLFYGSTISEKSKGKVFDNYGIKGSQRIAEVFYADSKSDNIEGLVCYGYGASRRMSTTSLAESKNDETTASLFSDNASLINAEEWLLQANYSALQPSSIQFQAAKRRDQIKELLIRLLPDVEDIRFSEPDKSSFKPGVEMKTPYGWVPVQSLSLGYRALIAWTVDLASRLLERYPNSKDPLAEPAVVLVDEIDLHLHPKWQRMLIDFLTGLFPNTQFIVTAHSPLVVQAASEANIVVLRREGDHVVIDNDVASVRGWRVDQLLTSDLFGLQTARPPQSEAALIERNRLLGKARLTKADREKLKRLEAQIGALPAGETPADMEAMDIIRRTAEMLKNGHHTAK